MSHYVLTPEQLNALYFESLTDRRTILRVYAGDQVKALARARIVRAAKKLRYPDPPQPTHKDPTS